MLTAEILDRQALACCNVAAGIITSGVFHFDQVWYDAAGFIEEPVAISAGDLDINAVLVGKIPQGTVICFRGTVSPDDETRSIAERVEDWALDFHAGLVTWRGVPGMVHSGFASAVDSLWPQIEPFITDDRGVIFAGHSKGGGCATLAALAFYLATGRPSMVTTFGAPRSMDSAAAKAVEGMPISIHRFQNHCDLVPLVPAEPTLIELLAHLIGKRLPEFDYRPAGILKAINAAGRLEGLESDFIFNVVNEAAILEKLSVGDFKAIREAHDIGLFHGYANAIAAEELP